DGLLVVPGLEHHAAGLHRGLRGRRHRQGQPVEDRVHRVQIRQVSLSRPVHFRVCTGLFPERQRHGYRRRLRVDHRRYLGLLLATQRCLAEVVRSEGL
ncbi:MAG: TRAP-type uncharacterized transport system, fused permease component, partial [Olavius algarvensis Gamma 1 endosymbiont]